MIKLNKISEKFRVKVFGRYYGTNPTGSFKDLGMSVAVSMAKEMGLRDAFTYSSGNAGSSLAAYATRAGMKTFIFVKSGITEEKLYTIDTLGAKAVMVHDLTNPWDLLERVSKAMGQVYYFTNFINPFRAEGHKTLAYDIFQDLKNETNHVVMPVGTGGGLWGCWRGFEDLKELDLINDKPRMVGVQPQATAHAYEAFKKGKEIAEPFGDPKKTIVQSLADSEPLMGDKRPLMVARKSKGKILAVTDQEVVDGIKEIGKEGLFVEPASATTYAAMVKEIEDGEIERGDNIVLSLTGSGLKQIVGKPIVYNVTINEIDKIIEYVKKVNEI